MPIIKETFESLFWTDLFLLAMAKAKNLQLQASKTFKLLHLWLGFLFKQTQLIGTRFLLACFYNNACSEPMWDFWVRIGPKLTVLVIREGQMDPVSGPETWLDVRHCTLSVRIIVHNINHWIVTYRPLPYSWNIADCGVKRKKKPKNKSLLRRTSSVLLISLTPLYGCVIPFRLIITYCS